MVYTVHVQSSGKLVSNRTFHLTLCMLGNFSADDILKCFSYVYKKTGFDSSCKLSPMKTICMECHIQFFLGIIRQNIINLSSAELAQGVVKTDTLHL